MNIIFLCLFSFHVWLIEVNSSPDVTYSTPVTEKLVKEAFPPLMNIVLYSPEQKVKINSYHRKIGKEEIHEESQKTLTPGDYGYWSSLIKDPSLPPQFLSATVDLMLKGDEIKIHDLKPT